MNEKKTLIYLQQKGKVQCKVNEVIRVGLLTDIVCEDEKLKQKIQGLKVRQVKPNDGSRVVISNLEVINIILMHVKVDLQVYGADNTIVEIGPKNNSPKILKIIRNFIVLLVVFIGAAMAIMNFHDDVSMSAAHQHIYKLFTGKENPHPLIIQIPYSIGIGVGMIVFFNHIYKKKINDEPSPLELEMDNYQTEVDEYVRSHPEDTNRKEKSR